jgi:hypothetical protein
MRIRMDRLLRVTAALADLAYTHIYPDPEARALRAGLAAFTGVPPEHLLAGAGADELIDLLLRVLLEPNDVVLNFPPTFGMYAFDTRLNAGKVVEIPRRPDFSLDLPAIRAAVEVHRPKVLFVTSPNNPDGSLVSAADFDALLDLPVVVVLDEAYIEFAAAGGGWASSSPGSGRRQNAATWWCCAPLASGPGWPVCGSGMALSQNGCCRCCGRPSSPIISMSPPAPPPWPLWKTWITWLKMSTGCAANGSACIPPYKAAHFCSLTHPKPISFSAG